MAVTEAMVRRFLPLRGGNMPSDDVEAFIAAAQQWVAGIAGTDALGSGMADMAVTLQAASLANFQIDASSGNVNSPKSQSLGQMAQDIVTKLESITTQTSDEGDVGTYNHLVQNPTPSALWPYRWLDTELVQALQPFEDMPPWERPYSWGTSDYGWGGWPWW